MCGTLALLAVLFNANIERGDILNNFMQFTEGFSPVVSISKRLVYFLIIMIIKLNRIEGFAWATRAKFEKYMMPMPRKRKKKGAQMCLA